MGAFLAPQKKYLNDKKTHRSSTSVSFRVKSGFLFVAITALALFNRAGIGEGAQSTFTQSNWTGQPYGTTTEVDKNLASWKNYAIADANLDTSSGLRLKYNADQKTLTTTADFTSDAPFLNGTRITNGTGDDGSIQLDGDATWSTVNFPTGFGLADNGTVLVSDGNRYLYAVAGGTKLLSRYDTVTGNWSSLLSYPASTSFGNGSALVYANGYLYASNGSGKNVYRYSITSNSWSAIANANYGFGPGGGLVWNSANYIYHVSGASSSKNFEAYSISTNSWIKLKDVPVNVPDGSAFAYDSISQALYLGIGGGYSVYKFHPTNWQTPTSGDVWSSSPVAYLPVTLDVGATFTAGASGSLYALSGGSSGTFMYSPSSGTQWSATFPSIGSMAKGGSIVYMPSTKKFYAFRGGVANFYSLKPIQSNVASTFESAPVDFLSARKFTEVNWDVAAPNTSTVSLEVAARQTASSSWSAWTPITFSGTSGSLADTVFQGKQYLKYRLTMSTTNTTTTPSLRAVTFKYANYAASAYLESSPYKMGETTQGPAIIELQWVERVPAGTTASVKLQLRTKSSKSFVDADSWYGSGSTVGEVFTYTTAGSSGGCTRTQLNATDYRVICPVSASSPLNVAGISYAQYKVLLSAPDGDTTPTVLSVSLVYDINTPPTVSNVEFGGQDQSGLATYTYSITDDTESSFDVGLYYDVGVRLLGSIGSGTGPVSVSISNDISLSSLLPPFGVLLIENEEIIYRSIQGNSFIIDTASDRGAFQSIATSHNGGATPLTVWVRATDSQIGGALGIPSYVNGDAGAGINCTAYSISHSTCSKTITWRPSSDLSADFYLTGQIVKVAANDRRSVNSLGGAVIGGSFTLDTKAPKLLSSPVRIVGVSVAGTTTGIKTNVKTVSLAVEAPDTTDDTPLSYLKYSVCEEATGSNTCGTFSLSSDGGVPSGWSALSSFSNLGSCPTVSSTLSPLASGTTCSSLILAGSGKRTVQFAAVDNVGNSKRGSAGIVVDQTAPPIPTNFSAQDASNQTVGALAYLRWDALAPSAVTDATGSGDFAYYAIYRNQKNDVASGCSSSATTFCLVTKVTNIATQSFADSGVVAGTSYQYKIIAVDNIVNASQTLSTATATSPISPSPTGQAVPPTPQLTNVVVGTPDTSSVTVSWNTDNSISDASVIYAGTATAPTSFSGYPSQGDPTIQASHQVTLVGLVPNTQYYLELHSIAPGNETHGVYPGPSQPALTFTTKQLPPLERPTITPGSPLVTPKETSALFHWATGSGQNDSPADSFVEYGTSSALGYYYGTRDTSITHEVTVPALQSNTGYYFRVRSAIPGKGEKAYPTTAPDPEVAPLPFTTLTPTNDTTAPTPTNMQVPAKDDTTALVTWQTTEPAVHSVEFWRVDDTSAHRVLPATPGQESTSASVLLSSLDPETDYYFVAISRDAAGNIGRSATQGPFTTLKDPRYTTNPVISNLRNDPAGVSTATIYFTSDQATTAVLRYSSDSDPTPYSQSQSFPAFVEGDHAVTLLGLTPGTAYSYKVEVTNPSGLSSSSSNCSGSSDSCSFATGIAQGALPSIIVSSIKVTKDAETANLVTVQWQTEQPGNSLVEFGHDQVDGVPQYGRTFGFVRDNGTLHTVTLPNDLIEGQTYYFRLRTRDNAGQLAVFPVTADLTDTTCVNPNPAPSTCKNPTFSTIDTGLIQVGEKIGPPVITGVAPLLVTDKKVVVGWTTDKPATSEVFLGTSTLFPSESTVSDGELTTVHAITIEGLQPSTQYYFAVASKDRNKQRQPDDNKGQGYTFKTNAGTKVGDNTGQEGLQGVIKTDTFPPQITSVEVSNITDFEATVTWLTNERATTMAQYGTDTAYGLILGDSSTFETSHSVLLPNLTGGTEYHFSIVAYDEQGNRAVSQDYTFTTTGEPGQKKTTDDKTTDMQKTDQQKNDEQTDATKQGSDTLTDIEKTIRELSADKQLSLQKIIDLLKDFDEADASKILDAVGLQLVAPPQFVGGAPRVAVTTDSSTIVWQTDKQSDSRVAFAPSDDYKPTASDPYGVEIGDTETYTRNHEITLVNLLPNTVYHYQVRSREQVGKTARSIDRTFKTLALQPEIKRLAVVGTSENTITLSWRTNVPAKSVISYTNATTGEELSQGNPQFLTLHNFVLRNLSGDTKYLMQVTVEDESGLTATPKKISAQTTKDEIPPVLDQIRTEVSLAGDNGNYAQAIISWKTNEPATSQIVYEEGVTKSDKLANSTEFYSEFLLSHVIVLTKLRPATVYRFRVLAADASENAAASRDYTLLTPQQKQSVLGIIINNFEQTFGFLKFLGWSQ
ncbi:hypothetical protein COV04_00515 [Candidatus Uhrbacteria bacterium CG10_big_fil_rev_8_21_14_0_10_48_11]|uniref:Fibronectin type-III domain-containing protein n=1 Tax=Candidatus Uhrbacteria bacterium CG10_big_fil_rev_8_21_14_0_10_48_11 TaxID=1975037 RepID=A0A2M8LFJ3_9BACT|nr:MAG: hypothetical protein COV04_00515 [Candidatus Uhrbacteria bacterium CG10_big_fil_rev_8_21_14_0_10_48_11]